MAAKCWLVIHGMVFLLLIACAGQGTPFESEPPTPMPGNPNVTSPPPGREELPPNPYAPGKGDESMQGGEAYIDSQEILILKSFPPQYQLHVNGSLPTPCHELRAVIDEPDERNRIQVQVFSLVDPNTICTQVLEPFEANIPLGSYASGSYTVFVNGEEVGEITP